MRGPADPESFTAETVQTCLRTHQFGRTLHLLEEVDSTNRVATGLALKGEPHGTVVVAERQTAGQGRMGRHWFSPAGDGLYCSMIVHASECPPARLSWIPLVSAVAVARAIRRVTAVEVRLKWPNDLLHQNQKLGGLLCESGVRRGGQGEKLPPFVIVGIGINVHTSRAAFPSELRDVATSLALAGGQSVNRLKLFVTLLEELESAWPSVASSPTVELARYYSEWCATLGRQICITLPGGQRLEGVAESVAEDGSLRIRRSGSMLCETLDIQAGDVVHVR